MNDTKSRPGMSSEWALARLLVRLNLIKADILKGYAPGESSLIAALAARGVIDEWHAIKEVAQALGIRSFEIKRTDSGRFTALLDHASLSRVPIERWKETKSIPVELMPDGLVLATANPLNHEAISALSFTLGCKVDVGIGSETEILNALSGKECAGSALNLQEIIAKDEEEDVVLESADDAMNERESSVSSADMSAPPVVRLVNKIFADAVYYRASDIHLSPMANALAVKLRVDGILQMKYTIPKKYCNPVISRIKLLSNMDIAERRRPQDGRVRITSPFGKRDLRVSTIPTANGETLVARILPVDLGRVSFHSLGMNEIEEARVKKALLGSSKIILVAGPTGSGKTSTLYACLMHLHDGETNIITIEDPVEYRIEGINQMQVNPKIGLNFADGLRAVLRQDPDVIMLGEIRDSETAGVSMQVAQTGHLVLSTIHTNNAVAAITRLRDLHIPAYLVASSLGMVIAQRLVRKLCSKCAAELSGAELRRCQELGLSPAGKKQAAGCTECENTGYKGRTPVFSFFTVDDITREAIRSEKSEQELERIARADGYKSLEEAGLELFTAGLTSLDELERVMGPLDKAVKPAVIPEAKPARKRGLRSQVAVRRVGPLSARQREALAPDKSKVALLFDEILADDETVLKKARTLEKGHTVE